MQRRSVASAVVCGPQCHSGVCCVCSDVMCLSGHPLQGCMSLYQHVVRAAAASVELIKIRHTGGGGVVGCWRCACEFVGVTVTRC